MIAGSAIVATRRAGRTGHIGRMRRGLLALFVVVGCLPRDPDGTLERVRGGVLRVGVVAAAPWVIGDPDGPPRGSEVDAVRGLAASLGAEVVWVPGGETAHMRALQARRLDLVIGGLVADSPYREEVGFTRPYADCDGARVVAGPPGENRWLMTVEAFLADHPPPCEAGR